MKKYTIKAILNYLRENDILLVDKTAIGEIEMPEVDDNLIIGADERGEIEEE